MPIQIIDDYTTKIRASLARRSNDETIRKLARSIAKSSQNGSVHKPVIFFNASTRLSGLSLNAAFSLLTAWGLRMAGVPVIHFVCRKGMSQCVLGTNRDHVTRELPCDKCIRHSQAEYDHANTYWFEYQQEEPLRDMMQGLGVAALEHLTYDDIPVGEIVLPALRWELRRHHLNDDEPTRYLFREFILSAWNVGREFLTLIRQVTPQAVVLFNGQFFPEAMVRYLARQEGIRVITHEVGMMPFTAFFTDGEATAYPMDIPESFQLNEEQNNRLDEYLSGRFKGNFKMAGIKFWQNIQTLDESFLQKLAGFKQVVPIFTNVIFDTSQPHSNVLFPDMFTWLDQVLEVVKAHPETMFVIRAHPDELRPGSAKQSRETVRDWVKNRQAAQLKNVIFVDATEYLSSYELIHRSKFVMVYNSSIGLEASILGSAVLAAGRSRYTRYPTVFFPDSAKAYLEQLETMLTEDPIQVPSGFQQQAKRVLYYQLYKTAIPFGDFLEEAHRPGLVLMKKFDPQSLSIEQSRTIKLLLEGILHAQPFILDN
jgi:hypothetical protein